MTKFINLIYIAVLIWILSSCKTQNLFQEAVKSKNLRDTTFVNSPYKIRSNDKISVSIWNHDDLSVGSLFGIYNSNEVYGKWILVDYNGNIKLPQVGEVKVINKTTTQVSEDLAKIYASYIKDPIIVVKVHNRMLTVLGEVRNPGTFLLETDKNNLFEVIGKAGGLEFYADKQNIQLIRNKQTYSINLTDNYFEIPVFAGDIINIPTKKGKTLDKKAPTIIPFASALTTLAIIASLLAK